MKFNVGVEVERRQVLDIIVEIEAGSLDEARSKATDRMRSLSESEFREATDHLSDCDWTPVGMFQVIGATEDDYEGYDPDVKWIEASK
jgi:hypothetical protein